MLDTIRRFFDENLASRADTDERGVEHRLQLATAAVLIEMSRADTVRRASELETIERGIADKFDLSPEETQQLIALAEEEAKLSVSDFDFVQLINQHFSQPQKLRIVELLWAVAYADDHLDKHEEHYVRRIAELLHVAHADFIAAKLRQQGG